MDSHAAFVKGDEGVERGTEMYHGIKLFCFTQLGSITCPRKAINIQKGEELQRNQNDGKHTTVRYIYNKMKIAEPKIREETKRTSI